MTRASTFARPIEPADATSPALLYLPVVTLIVVTAMLGPSLGSHARLPFLLAAFAVGWHAWSRSPYLHVQVVLVLFSLTPLLRRLVDYSAGFDASGMMIAGPLFALLAPAPELRKLLFRKQTLDLELVPIFGFLACVAYGAVVTLLQGELTQAISGALKWAAPVIYAVVLYLRAPNVPRMLNDVTAAFVVILPITSLYGLYQYIDPPMWDRYWLTYAAITSAGLPEPYAIRTFSTMHAPAAFATFTATGIFLIYFLSAPRWPTRIVLIAAVIALLLSLYRTAWLSLAAGVVYCMVHEATRKRAAGATAALFLAVLIALLLTPFGTVISDRLATLGEGSGDGSARERLGEFAVLWSQPNSGLFGKGFINTDIGVAGALPTDGMIAMCWASMGIIVGLVCLVSLFAVCAEALRRTGGKDRSAVTLGALITGFIVQIPLANMASGELGFLFWLLIALALRCRPAGRTA